VIVNSSLWRDVASLQLFAYQSRHVEFIHRRKEWFKPMDGPFLVLWWVDGEHLPDVDEAEQRLKLLTSKSRACKPSHSRRFLHHPNNQQGWT
jgi:hypothetical protein